MARRKRLLDLAGGGDDGSTGLLGGGRAAKDDPRIEAYGTVDEASSAIGLARALSRDERVREVLEELQRGLYVLGAELATGPAARRRFAQVSAADVERLEALTAELEAAAPMPAEFVLPGTTPASGALDLARTVARRAERRCVALSRTGGFDNLEARRWLNRLSLLLFVLARYEEARSGRGAKLAKGVRG
ncbi:MAG TPA: cob(I)yrinic acid a,c-diamide adenosyltransferase [Candidatus Acidoferrales bacterium]|nr:cob(I)yrinic acid a,c-diamide adenosyltransferase [Candidatus Acidoferrales bacterium]